jgi:hypothetical protein
VSQEKKFYRTEFKLVVLSEEKPANDMSLRQIAHEITDGDCSGDLEEVEVRELTPKEAADALIEQGSDPDFFGLDEDGNAIDD